MKTPSLSGTKSPADNVIIGSKVRLRDKRLADARGDYAWQTDLELTQLDATSPVVIPFSRYVSTYASELRHPSATRRQFAIETLDGKHIGNCGYYHIDKAQGEVELGIMIGNRDYWDKGFGTDTITILLNYIFRQTGFKRIYLKTLEGNIRAQRCFKKCGFAPYVQLTRDGFYFVLMEISREQWEERQRET